jgi:hypothetical protein
MRSRLSRLALRILLWSRRATHSLHNAQNPLRTEATSVWKGLLLSPRNFRNAIVVPPQLQLRLAGTFHAL